MAQHRITVLVLEDTNDISTLMREFLESEGYRTLEASTLGQALALLDREAVGVVVADAIQESPGRLDLGFLAPLREQASSVPIILCSARPGVDQIDPPEVGLFAALAKPFDLMDLLDLIHRATKAGDGSERDLPPASQAGNQPGGGQTPYSHPGDAFFRAPPTAKGQA